MLPLSLPDMHNTHSSLQPLSAQDMHTRLGVPRQEIAEKSQPVSPIFFIFLLSSRSISVALNPLGTITHLKKGGQDEGKHVHKRRESLHWGRQVGGHRKSEKDKAQLSNRSSIFSQPLCLAYTDGLRTNLPTDMQLWWMHRDLSSSTTKKHLQRARKPEDHLRRAGCTVLVSLQST